MCFRPLFSFGCNYLRGNPTKMTQNTQNMGTERLKEYDNYVPNTCLYMYCMCIYRYVYRCIEVTKGNLGKYLGSKYERRISHLSSSTLTLILSF